MKWCVLYQGARCVAQRLRISMGWFWRLDGWCLGQRAETKSAIALLLPSHCLWSNSHFDPVKLYKVNRRSIKRAKRTNRPNLLLNKPNFGCDRPNLPNFLHQTDLIQWNHIVPHILGCTFHFQAGGHMDGQWIILLAWLPKEAFFSFQKKSAFLRQTIGRCTTNSWNAFV